MKVTHVSVSDVSGGGGFRAAYRLHVGLRNLGHISRMIVQNKLSSDPDVIAFAPPIDMTTRTRRVFRRHFLRYSRKVHFARRPDGAIFFSDDRSEHASDVLLQMPNSDVLNLHWIAGLFDYAQFFQRLPSHLPLVWTLHDMNQLTGGCHHADSCRKFCESCGACPQLDSSNFNDFSHDIWRRKARAYSHLQSDRVRIVTPSRWLAGEARQSALMGRFSISVIPNGLDTQRFQPRDRHMAREIMGVPSDASVLLFVSHRVENKHKGLPLLIEAMTRLREIRGLFLLILGEGSHSENLPVASASLGFVSDERLLSLAYSAADLYLLPTLMDNAPNTALESMACGLPVVAFQVGGVPEIVRDGSTGVLVEQGDAEALANAIKDLLGDQDRRRQMAENCRRIAVEEYALGSAGSTLRGALRIAR